MDYRLAIADCRLAIADWRLQIADWRLTFYDYDYSRLVFLAIDYGLWTIDMFCYGLSTMGYGLSS